MTQSASDNYKVEEAKAAGAKPKYYIAFYRTSKSFSAATYAAGSHINTKFVSSNLQLAAGQTSGNWTSAILDSGHLTPNVIFDYATWTQVLNGGTVTVQLRSAAVYGSVTAASYSTYTNAVLDHTSRYRYYQIKISLTGDTSPTVASFVLRHKALIPRSEYKSMGSISCGAGIDLSDISAGGVSVTLDNSLYQWDKRNAASYIYGLSFYFQKLEIWAGFELADTSIEWLLQFVGEIESLTVGSGGDAEGAATLSARDFLFRKLSVTKIGAPTSTGTPSPYMAGKRYRVPCIETASPSYTNTTIAFVDSNPDTITDTANGFVDAGIEAGDEIRITGTANNNNTYTVDTVIAGTITLIAGNTVTAEAAGAAVTVTINHVFSFYCSQSISTIDATYTKSSESNTWDTASPKETSTANKTVTFITDPGASVSVDITVNATDHPCDIITDIITNILVLDSDQYSATSIATTKTRTSGLAVGVSFDNITVLEALRQLARVLDAAIFIENGVLKAISWYPDIDETLSFTDSKVQDIQITDSMAEIQNVASVYYGNYAEEKTNYSKISLTDSVAAYGELSGEDFDFTYKAAISITSPTVAVAILGHRIARESDQAEVIIATLPLDILRIEIMDILALTAAKHSFTAQKVQVYNKDVSLDSYNGKIAIVQYTGAQYMYFQDADPTEDLFYFVDNPVPSDQELYRSYNY
jgi:hypothetical protein